MGKFEGVLFATDLDDTLLDRKKGVSQKNREAIEYFRREGGVFTYATGRSLQSFELPRKFLPKSGPVVLSNGSVVYDYEKGELLFSCSMGPESVQVAEEIITLFPEVGMEFYQLDAVYAYKMNAPMKDHLDRVGIRENFISVQNPGQVPTPWIKGIFVHEYELLQQVETYFRGKYGGDFELVFSDPTLLEMQDLSGNKGEGVQKLADLLGISARHVYVAGDQQNDLAMLKRFQAFVPENGTPEALAEADWVVRDCDEDAIAHAIEILDGIYGDR